MIYHIKGVMGRPDDFVNDVVRVNWKTHKRTWKFLKKKMEEIAKVLSIETKDITLINLIELED